ncbi:MAG TPA: 5'-3' exonuclease H3TH domain-containing protein [Polyangiaceae bacterium]|nr:5'-3' exonuclease H3TH domain-containing protein [Polyangiaceae bacterium]
MVLLFDTFSLFFRAHYALPPMSTSSGEPTGALYGFSALTLKLLREHRGAELAFALDAPAATFRHEAFAGYKAERPPVPDDLARQFARLEQLLEVLSVPTFRLPGFEADDVLSTLAAELRREGTHGLVVSGDRDLLQVVSQEVHVLFVGRRGKEAVTYDVARVIERFGVPPERLPSYLALVGDASDNLPGVPGIGPGTAKKLLAQRSSCSELLSKLGEVGSTRVRQSLERHREQILLTERLARLRDDLPLGDGPRRGAPTRQNLVDLRALFAKLEFKSLLTRIDALLGLE